MKLLKLTILFIPFFYFSQTKVKEKREVNYTVFTDKNGFEKSRKKNFVENVTKYDPYGNVTQYNHYGEYVFNKDSTDKYRNYKNKVYSTKYSYINNTLIADSTYYYKNNKFDFLYLSSKYFFDTSKNVLLRKEEFNDKNEIYNIVIYNYNNISLVVQKIEIQFHATTETGIDTTITDYYYDDKKRLIKEKEVRKAKNEIWMIESEYKDGWHRLTKYYLNNKNKFPFKIDQIELDNNGNPIRIETHWLHWPASINRTEITYNKNGLINTEIEIGNIESCYFDDPRTLIVYEYEYY